MNAHCRVLPHFPQLRGLVPQYGVQKFKTLYSQRLGFAKCIGTFVKELRNNCCNLFHSVTIISHASLACRNASVLTGTWLAVGKIFRKQWLYIILKRKCVNLRCVTWHNVSIREYRISTLLKVPLQKHRQGPFDAISILCSSTVLYSEADKIHRADGGRSNAVELEEWRRCPL